MTAAGAIRRYAASSTSRKPPTARKVVKTKHFVIEPMSLEEAIAQMEDLGHDFFLFFDAGAAEVRLLYRRNDGDYGLIEPEFKS